MSLTKTPRSHWHRGLCPWTLLVGLLVALVATLPAGAAERDLLPRNVQFSNLTAREGLSSEFVHAVVQDAEGFIWFGTQDGLNRFDGHDIVVYEHDPEDPESISDNFVRALYVDRSGALLVGTNQGVNRYNPDQDNFERDPLGLGPEPPRVRALLEDHDGLLWIGTVDEGLLAMDRENGSITTFRHDPSDPNSLPGNQVIAMLEDRKHRLWIGTNGAGLARLVRASDSFVVYRHNPSNPQSLSNDAVRALYEDFAGNLWIGTAQGGLNLMADNARTFRRFMHDPAERQTLAPGQITAVFEDSKGTLWVGSEAGLFEWRPSIQGFVHYGNDVADPFSLVGNRVNAMFQDRSGVLWLATHGGVSSWNYFSDTLTYFRAEQGLLADDLVSSMAETTDGVLWVGTYGGGLSRVDLVARTSRHYRADLNDPGSLTDDRVMTVHVDPWDRVWVGTRSGGLNLLNPDGDSFTAFRHDPENPTSLSGDAITSIHTSTDGTLWVGVFDGGLNRASRDAPGAFERFRQDPMDPTSLSSDRVLTLHRDQQGALWVGTEDGGLNRYEPSSRSFIRVPISEDGSSAGTPWDIVEARDGTFWISTLGDGLLRWDREQRLAGEATFERFRKKEGLPATVYGAIEGAAGELWLSSNRGLFRFEPSGGDVRHFDRHNGLLGTEFSVGAQLRSRSGQLLFGGSYGMVGFFPGELHRNDRPPQISVVAESRDQVLGRGSSQRQLSAIALGYLDPFVAFDFVAHDTVSPDKNQYRYRLSGFDEEWITASRFRHAAYSNLPTGSFRFEVQASNNDGVWNTEGVSVDVLVAPPPWRSWWAYLSYALIALALISWYLRLQRLKLRQESQARAQLELQVRERTAELAARNTELQTLNERLAEASVTDSLTGLRNRRYVDQFVSSEVARIERERAAGDDARRAAQVLFFMMIDLDGFKAINDRFGHHAGDQVLRQVTRILLDCCRASDVVVRWGGDEFLIVGQAANVEGAKGLAERIRAGLAHRAFNIGNGNIGRLSASIGLAPYPFGAGGDTAGWETVADIADQAAYLAKQNGRDAWVSICAAAGLTGEEVLAMALDLKGLHERGRIIFDGTFGQALELGAEAAVRPQAALA